VKVAHSPRPAFRMLFIGVLVALIALVVGASAVLADTYTVTNANDSGLGSLRNAVNLANGHPGADTVAFSGLPASSTITLITGEIVISDALTIDASGVTNLAVSGGGISRVFNVPVDVPLTIESLTIERGVALDAGGGISAVGDLTLNNTSVLSCIAQTLGGGAAVSGTATLTGGVFQGNVVTMTWGLGGGLYVGEDLSMTDTRFYTNTAIAGGGAFVQGNTTLSGGVFEENAAVHNLLMPASARTSSADTRTPGNGEGGGLWGGGNLDMSGTQFLRNMARLGGGAFVGGNATLNDGTFNENTLYRPDALASAVESGGAVMQLPGGFTTGAGGGLVVIADLNMTNTTFYTNTAMLGGGAAVSGTATLMGGVFQDNEALPPFKLLGGAQANQLNTAMPSAGGGLVVGQNLHMTDTQFLGNSAPLGGGVMVNTGNATLVNGLFQENYSIALLPGASVGGASKLATGSLESAGGGLLVMIGNLDMSGTRFLDNSTEGSGGAGPARASLGQTAPSHPSRRC
jgi:hypothetical protein